MKNRQIKSKPYSKIIDFSLEQDLYKKLCLQSSPLLEKSLCGKKKYHYYGEWKVHIEQDCLALFKTQQEINEFIRYCKMRYSTAKLFDNSIMAYVTIIASAIFPFLAEHLVSIGTNMVLVSFGIEFVLFFLFYLIMRDMKNDYFYKAFFEDIIEIAQGYIIDS